MPRPSPATVDPIFAEIAKTIYGDVDAREIAALAKFSPGSSDLHADGPMSDKEARRQKRVAYTGLGATGVATVAGLDATRTSIKEFRHRAAEGKEGRAVGPVARKLVRLKMSPKTAGLAVGTGLLGLHGVELASDAMGAHAQLKQLRAANASLPDKKPVAKAFRLKPLNTLPNLTPSLRAKRVKLAPSPANPKTKGGLYQPVGKGLRSYIRAGRTTLRNVKSTSENAQRTAQNMSDASGKFNSMFAEHGERAAKDAADAARNASEATDKIKRLIPSRRTAVLAATGAVGTLAGLPAAGSYAGSYAGNRHGNKNHSRVRKSAPIDVTWSGVISKVDTDKRRVFGWASVSAINGEQVVDLQGDIVPIEEVEKSAYRYVIESRKGGDMHKRVSKLDQPLHTADMIESFVVTPEKLEKMGLPPDALPHGWWCGFHVNDDAQWALVKSGERTGFSIHGSGKRTPIGGFAKSASRVDADSASPVASRRYLNKRVSRVAGRLSHVQGGGSGAAADVFDRFDHLQMGGVDARGTGTATRTNVVKVLSGRYRPKEMLIDHSMGAHESARLVSVDRTTPDEPVSKFVHHSGPQPARTGVVDVAKGSFVRSPRDGRHGYIMHKVSKRVRNQATGRAKVNPMYSPQHSANSRVKAANKMRLKVHRFGPELSMMTDFTPGILQTVGTQVYPLLKADRLDRIKDRAEDAGAKVARSARRTGKSLQNRTNQAVSPPTVKLHRVKSSAIRSMGYQPQTRRLAVEMRTRPGQPYEYKMKPGAAIDALTAPSKGAHFATQVRGKAKRAGGYTPADRARLFMNPVSKAGPKEIGSRPPQYGHRDEGFGANARPADGRRITDKPPRYSLKGSAKEFRRGAGGGFKFGATKVTYGGPGGDKYARKVFHHAFKQKVAAEALDSAHGGAFRAGVRAGRSGVHALKYGPYALVGTGVVAAGKKAVDDNREANRRIAARQQAVGKGVGSAAGYAAMAAMPLAGGYGGYVLGSEINRKLYNKHGAGLKPWEAAAHPIRANYKASAGARRRAAAVQLNRAEKATNQRRAEYHRIRAERFNTEANSYARKAGIRKAAQVYEPAVTGLPGDNRQAQMARSRRKTGLGVAGAGYLVATRGKDIAPEIASLGTRSAKKIGAGKYANQVARRAKAISNVTGKGGAILVGGGLALAGEGAIADLHHRNQYARARKQVSEYARNHPGRKQFQKSAFGIEDDRIDKGLSSMFAKPLTSGATKLGGGVKSFLPKLKPIKATPGGLKLSTAGKVGVGGLAAGGIGALGNGQLGKAFDPERSRHGRQDIYAGAAAGGATIAGAGAVVTGRQARGTYRAAAGAKERAAGNSSALREHLARMAQPTQTGGLGRSPKNIAQAQKLHRTTRTQAATAERILTRAKRLTRISGGLGAGAAALGGVAYGLHNYDRRRGGRSYGY